MSGKSKLDYLKRYGDAGAASEGGKKRKRRKVGSGSGSGKAMKIVDMDLDIRTSEAKVNRAWEDPEDDDGPVVVVPEEHKREVRGGWQSVAPRHGHGDDASPPRRRRQDSPDASPPRRKRQDSPDAPRGGKGESEVNSSAVPRKTASGYTAGLRKTEDFLEEDRKIKQQRREELDPEQSGRNSETVYRDRKGRKLDMLNEFMRQQAIREGKEVKEKEEQYEWGKGNVQKAKEVQFEEELRNIANEPFARTVNDPKIDAMYREKIHADDPMAAYMMKKRQKERPAGATGKPVRPVYKGPQPKPNRFGIPPGYRWDGRDRGNGWEERVLAETANRKVNREAAHEWSVADM